MKIRTPVPEKKSRLEIIPLIDIMFFLLASFMMISLQMQIVRTVKANLPTATLATESDFENEFLDLILAVKVVDSLDEAVAHVARYGTGHSEAIVTEDVAHGEYVAFLDADDRWLPTRLAAEAASRWAGW